MQKTLNESLSPEGENTNKNLQLQVGEDVQGYQKFQKGMKDILSKINNNEGIGNDELEEIMNNWKMMMEGILNGIDVQNNLSIWKKVMKGNYDRAKEMTRLIPCVATALSGLKWDWLDLYRLTSLSEDVAKILSKFKGSWLNLNGLTSLNKEVATALSEFKEEHLSFGRLTSLNKEVATALSGFEGNRLYLNGLTSLSEDVATALSEFEGNYLYLNGLPSLSEDVAKGLSAWNGKSLWIENIKEVSAKTHTYLNKLRNKGCEINSYYKIIN